MNDEIKRKDSLLPNETEDMGDEKPLFYVGIGASAGGLEALEKFFDSMSDDTKLAFIVVQHLSPDYKSMMVELLSRHTSLEVYRSEDGMKVKANCIYLIPPKKNMTIFNGVLQLTEQDHRRGLNLPIDIFFRSLALDQRKNSIGIILSGTGSDGTLGIRAIKEVGGMVMVQDNVSAKFDGMPKSAIATALVDYILPPEQMPKELLKYTRHPYIKDGETKEELGKMGEDVLSKILEIIRNRLGVDFANYKPNTLIRRLERRMSINQINKIENYIKLLNQSPQEVQILYKELLIGVTQFFRDSESFQILKQKVLPVIFEEQDKESQIRLWTVACSTGEEAYSVAILLQEYMDEQNIIRDVKVFATDLDKDAIEYAGVGKYPESIVTDVTPERLNQYFIKRDDGYQVKENIRRMVIFAPHNVIKDPPFSKIDLVSCRNLLIYLKPEMQKKIISMFQFATKVQGFLFLGSSESVGNLSDIFIPVSTKWKIYRFKQDAQMPVMNDIFIPQLRNARITQNRRIHNETANSKQSVSETKQMETVYEKLIRQFVPPSILIDENYEIVQVFQNVNEFIKIPIGKVSWNVLRLVRSELSVLLSSMVQKAKKDKDEVKYKNINLRSKDDNEKNEKISLSVQYLDDKNTKNKFFIISFEKEQETLKADGEYTEYDVNEKYSERIKDLERELVVREESLQTTLEEMETSNEELQATNEELIASNEELQSTNEELQSVNEELYTVNSEYHNKIEELTALNNDMNNLLRNTNIGTLFLDSKLRIRKYTEHITKVINVMDIDIGRPVSHLSFNTIYDSFFDDVEDVMENLLPKVREIQDNEENWYLMKIMPYRTTENAVNGVIITTVNINDLKKAEEELKRERDLFYRVLESSPTGKIVTDKEGHFTYLNKKGEEILEISQNDIENYVYNKFDFEILDLDKKPMKDEDLPFRRIMRTQKTQKDIEHYICWKDGRCKKLHVHGAPMFDENGDVNGAVFSMEEVEENEKIKSNV